MDNVMQIIMYFVLLLHAIFDIFLVTYLANEITTSSENLSYCMYGSNWIDLSESSKRNVLIVGEVLKQPQQLVILIYPINVETFTAVS